MIFMANGCAAALAVTVEKEDILKQGFDSLVELESILSENNLSIDDFAQIANHIELHYGGDTVLTDEQLETIAFDYDIDNDVLRHSLILYRLFRIDFDDSYKLDISLGYHNDDNGDIYDTVSGAFFAIDFGDVYQVSDKAKAMEKDIPFELSQFVVHG